MYLACTDYRDFVSTLPDRSIDLVVTDPPYLHRKSHMYKDYANSKSAFSKSALYRYGGKMLGDMSQFGKEQIYEMLSLS